MARNIYRQKVPGEDKREVPGEGSNEVPREDTRDVKGRQKQVEREK